MFSRNPVSREVLIQHPHSLSTAVGIFRYFQVSTVKTYFSVQAQVLNQGHEPNCRNRFTPGRFLYAMTIFLSMQVYSVLPELVLIFLFSLLIQQISLQPLCKTSHGLVQHDNLYLKTVSLKQFKYFSLTSRKIFFYFWQKLLSRQSRSFHFT